MARTRIPSPEVREKLSTVTPADLEAELELRRSQDERNSLRYQREQGWQDFDTLLRDCLRDLPEFVRVEGIVGYMGAVMDQLRRRQDPQLIDNSPRAQFNVGEREQ